MDHRSGQAGPPTGELGRFAGAPPTLRGSGGRDLSTPGQTQGESGRPLAPTHRSAEYSSLGGHALWRLWRAAGSRAEKMGGASPQETRVSEKAAFSGDQEKAPSERQTEEARDRLTQVCEAASRRRTCHAFPGRTGGVKVPVTFTRSVARE